MITRNTNKLKFIFATFLVLSLWGCFGGGSSEPTRYYSVAVEKINKVPSNELLKQSLLVKKFSIESAYQKPNIVYRESPYDFAYYDLDQWASRPELLITQVVFEYMNKSEMFGSTKMILNDKPDLEFSGHIFSIEEIDKDDSQYAHLSMVFTLKNTSNGKLLWEHSFDETNPTNKKGPRAFAETISKLLGTFIETSLQEISKIK